MSTDNEQPTSSGFRNWWTTIVWSKAALMFAFALPALAVVVALCEHFNVLSSVPDPLAWFLLISLTTCPVIAIVCGFLARAKEPTTSGSRVGCVAIVLGSIQTLFILSVVIYAIDERSHHVSNPRPSDNLQQLYCFLTIYAQNSNCYPSMQPHGSTNNGGTRDLYPLYLMAVNKQAFLRLLQPPGIELVPFSSSPGPEEFDSDHIGYIYNSLVLPDQSNNPPVMAERCVEDGMFTAGEKPVFKDCAHILLANGTVKKVLVKNGKLILGDIKVEDLEKLK